MRAVLACAAAAVAAAAFGGTAATAGRASDAPPTLRLARAAPLTLRGGNFEARERVRLTVTTTAGVRRRHVTANAAGAFVVRFAGLSYDRCGDVAAVAEGDHGSRARWKIPPTLCPPRP